MRFVSTRGGDAAGFSDAVMRGLAADGGLFVPETPPDLRSFLPRWRGLPYRELAAQFLALFATDVPPAELRRCVNDAYAAPKFPEPDAPARLVTLGSVVSGQWSVVSGDSPSTDHRLSDTAASLHVLELFHGPTLAFKDFALQFLGQLYARHTRATGAAVNILGATSGDTGSAAIHGLLGVPGAHSFILYPAGRVAALQERQIACTGSPNVHPLAVAGSFDDAQRIVKSIFADRAFTRRHALTAVNSINIARILAQCVYYLDAALKLGAGETSPVEFVVPTGNFGNILAGWLLTKMGVAGVRFCVATNANAVVSDFFRDGVYRVGGVTPTLAPSMDIQQASNFERWLWWRFDGDAVRVKTALATLREHGEWRVGTAGGAVGGTAGDASAAGGAVSPEIRPFACDDAGIRAVIRAVRERYGYVCDPHTACGFAAVLNETAGSTATGTVAGGEKNLRRVILATASPAKFPEVIEEVLGIVPTDPSLEALRTRPIVRQEIPADEAAVRAAI
ncbi:MAG: threonine synthase, partial [Puniceicoccales bacterium]|nr:threonine synthase [Puniceicoccales bacterium]